MYVKYWKDVEKLTMCGNVEAAKLYIVVKFFILVKKLKNPSISVEKPEELKKYNKEFYDIIEKYPISELVKAAISCERKIESTNNKKSQKQEVIERDNDLKKFRASIENFSEAIEDFSPEDGYLSKNKYKFDIEESYFKKNKDCFSVDSYFTWDLKRRFAWSESFLSEIEDFTLFKIPLSFRDALY